MVVSKARVEVDVVGRDKASAAFKKAKSGFQAFIMEIRQQGLAFVFVGQQLQQFGRQMREAVDESKGKMADFNKTMVQFSVLATDSAEHAERMSTGINEMAVRFGESATDLAVAGREIAAMGFNIGASMQILEDGTRLAIGGLSDARTASVLLVNTIKQFGFNVSETSHLINVFAAAANKTAADVTDMATAMQYAGPIASSLGIRIEEVAAVMGILRNAGLEASMAGTNFRQMLVKLQAPSKEATVAIVENDIVIREHTAATRRLSDEIRLAASSFNQLKATNASLSVTIENSTESLRILAQEEERLNNIIDTADDVLLKHKQGYIDLSKEIKESEKSLMRMDSQLRSMTDNYDEFSDQMRDNDIAIAEIRRRAEKENRELTESELSRIQNLEEANKDIRIAQMKRMRSIDEMRERVEEETEASRENEKALQSLRQKEIEPYLEALQKIQKESRLLQNETDDNTAAFNKNENQIKALDTLLDGLSKQYSVSGGKMRGVAEIVAEVEEKTKGMTVAQRENLVNMVFGVRGMAAFNTLSGHNIKALVDLTEVLEKSSDAYDGQGFAANATSEMLKNYSTDLARIREKQELWNREIGQSGVEMDKKFKAPLADLQAEVATTNSGLVRSIGVFKDVGGRLMEIGGGFLQVIPLLLSYKYLSFLASKETAALGGAAAKTGGKFSLFGGNLGVFMSRAGATMGALGGLRNAISLASKGLLRFLGPIGLVVTAVEGGSLAYQHFVRTQREHEKAQTKSGKSVKKSKTRWDSLTEAVGEAGHSLQGAFAPAAAAVRAEMDRDKPVLRAFIGMLQSLGKVLMRIANVFVLLVGRIVDSMIMVIDAGIRGLTYYGKELYKFLDESLRPVTQYIDENVAPVFADWAHTIQETLVGALDAASKGLEGFWELLGDVEDRLVGRSVVPAMDEFARSIRGVMATGGAEYFRTMGSALGDMESPALSIAGRVGPAAVERFASENTAPTRIGQQRAETISRITNNAPNVTVNMANNDWRDPELINTIRQVIREAANGM